MPHFFLALLLLLSCLPELALAACVPLRAGYMDQHRPPYWLGNGEQVPDPPGASVDLMHDAVLAAGFGCAPAWVRLPLARLRVALADGDIDMAPLGEQADYPSGIALPRDKRGRIDTRRALSNHIFVLVRAGDKLAPGTDPRRYFKHRVLGAPQGQSYIARLRQAGLNIDDGARDLERNLEKLRLGRVDGVLMSAVTPAHVQSALAPYRGAVAQLSRPLLTSRVWLAFNAGYYQRHQRQAEALWTWLDTHRGQLGYVMEKYRHLDQAPLVPPVPPAAPDPAGDAAR